ncbi:MAG TPA: di-heme oxidoredictase family protein [Vicinamibacterales bacterium]|nr:di-heme oxidoredictase family protein [Vicinamibacterales bacterium]
MITTPDRFRHGLVRTLALLCGSLGLATALWAQARMTLPGDPLPGLTPAEFEEFRMGLDDFLEVETAEEGLGPAFNGTSCAVCHNVPAIGGAGTIAEIRAGRRNDDGTFSALDPSGETLFHLFSIPSHACQPAIPAEATVIARRAPIPLFGAGLVEAIPDETLLDLEDPTDRDRDGVSGRAAIVTDRATGDRRVGRFGWKAQHATLLTFGADAYRNEMGITNDVFPDEAGFGVSADQMRLCDPIPDPEDVMDPRTRRRGIDNFASFMRFLAPAARGEVDDAARTGERVFHAIGCAACHVPSLQTGPSSNPLFDRRNVPLFSDLLLHDIGTGDGIEQAAASGEEIRTPALWGLRLRRPLLHDGSAATIEIAIRRHAGEAALARRGFERLSDADRAMLLAFLRSL